jgi:hypothetical protein
VKIALAAAHFHLVGVARQGPWCTVEDVGIELIVTTNQAPRVPKSGVSGPRSGVNAGTKAIFTPG